MFGIHGDSVMNLYRDWGLQLGQRICLLGVLSVEHFLPHSLGGGGSKEGPGRVREEETETPNELLSGNGK